MNGEQRAYVDYEIDLNEAKIIVFIFECCAAGWGLRAIALPKCSRGYAG